MKRIALTLALLAGSLPTWAQTAADAAASSTAPAPAATTMSMGQILGFGGWLMYPLFGLSMLGLALIIYFAVVVREEQVLPRRFVTMLRDLLVAGRFVEAQSACRTHSSAIAAIMGVALDYRLRTTKPDHQVMTAIVDGEGSRQAQMIQNQIMYLADIGGIAPMIGLLGTVIGMLRAFNVVALDLAKAKPMLLAGGVSQALITTVAGLLVAIPAMIAYAYFRGRTSRLISDLEKTSADLLTLIVKE